MEPHTDLETTLMLAVNYRQRTTRVWVLAFNLCSRFDFAFALERPNEWIAELVFSFYEHNPY